MVSQSVRGKNQKRTGMDGSVFSALLLSDVGAAVLRDRWGLFFDVQGGNKRMIHKSLWSSARGDWGTPPDLFRALDAEFHFTLDAAANEKNAKCAKFFTPETDALTRSWKTEGAVWCNPPYGRDVGKWVRKAFVESGGDRRLLCCYTPAPTQDGFTTTSGAKRRYALSRDVSAFSWRTERRQDVRRFRA